MFCNFLNPRLSQLFSNETVTPGPKIIFDELLLKNQVFKNSEMNLKC